MHAKTQELFDMLCTDRLIPCISKPTRITHSSATSIDIIYVRLQSDVQNNAAILIGDMSDHLLILYYRTKMTGLENGK